LDEALVDWHHQPEIARAWICGVKTRAFQIFGMACVFWAWGWIDGSKAIASGEKLKARD
jgi:hypothetical protein